MAHEWRSFQGGLPPQKMAHRFLWEYLRDYAHSGIDVQRCAIELMLEGPYSPSECHLKPSGCAHYGRPALMQLATDEYSLGAGFAIGSGSGALYHFMMDIEAAGGTCGSCHGGDLSIMFGTENTYFSSPDFRASNDRWPTLQPMLIEYWTSFAKTGVPTSSAGPAWKPASRDRHSTWGLPVMAFNLSAGIGMSSTAWLNNGTQDAVTSLLCGKGEIPEQCRHRSLEAVIES